MEVSLGRIVHYKLNSSDAEAINKRRADWAKNNDPNTAATGFQAYVGNSAREGAVYPLIITGINGSGAYASVNGQVMLDGNDVFWATSRIEGDLLGQWMWPTIKNKEQK